jgi:hypothetical protein
MKERTLAEVLSAILHDEMWEADYEEDEFGSLFDQLDKHIIAQAWTKALAAYHLLADTLYQFELAGEYVNEDIKDSQHALYHELNQQWWLEEAKLT